MARGGKSGGQVNNVKETNLKPHVNASFDVPVTESTKDQPNYWDLPLLKSSNVDHWFSDAACHTKLRSVN